MNKDQFVKMLAKTTGRSYEESESAVVDVLAAMVGVVASGERLSITGFGVMDLTLRSNTSYNFHTRQKGSPEPIIRVRFKAGSRFTRLAAGDDPLPPPGVLPMLKLPKTVPGQQGSEQAPS